jgi:Peptidase U49
MICVPVAHHRNSVQTCPIELESSGGRSLDAAGLAPKGVLPITQMLIEEPEGELEASVIRLLLDGVAPERAPEFKALFSQLQPQFFISKQARDYGGFCALEGRNHILIGPNMRDVVWFLSFAAWYAFRARIPQEALAALLPRGPMRDEVLLAEDPGYLQDAAASRDITQLAIQLLRRPISPDTPWPDIVPFPAAVIEAQERGDPKLRVDHVATKDLALFAVAYVLLHELHHIVLNSGRADISRLREELASDEFAIDQILGRAATWQPSDGSSVDPAKVIFKRSLGLLVGFFVLHAFTPDRLRGTHPDYPSLLTRLTAIVNAIALPEDHSLWLFGATLLRELQGDSDYAVLSIDSTQSTKANFLTLAERGFR